MQFVFVRFELPDARPVVFHPRAEFVALEPGFANLATQAYSAEKKTSRDRGQSGLAFREEVGP